MGLSTGTLDLALRSLPMPYMSPIVFVVDDDVSVRESLEMLIRHEGWQVETFATARIFSPASP